MRGTAPSMTAPVLPLMEMVSPRSMVWVSPLGVSMRTRPWW